MPLSPGHLCGSCPRGHREGEISSIKRSSCCRGWCTHRERKNDIIRLIGLPTRPSEKPASPTLTGSHPALTTLSTARAPTPVNWATEDGSVAHAFLSYLWRSSSTVLLQRAFDKPLRDLMLCWQHRGKILMHRFSKFSPGERHARVWRMRPLSSV
jgi:hypothetical protein